MPDIEVENVPDDVYAELQRRAAGAGQSLEEYLLARLMRLMGRPDADEPEPEPRIP